MFSIPAPWNQLLALRAEGLRANQKTRWAKAPSLLLLAGRPSPWLLVGTVYAGRPTRATRRWTCETPDLHSIPRVGPDHGPCRASAKKPKDIPAIGCTALRNEGSDLHVSGTGIGSLLLGHPPIPAKAWEVVLPISLRAAGVHPLKKCINRRRLVP